MTEEVYSKEESRILKVGFGVALTLIVLVVAIASSRKKIASVEGSNFYDVIARYNRTDGLLVGDLVRMAGMDVGRVVDAKLDDHFKAVLTLEINGDIKIPDDSSASIVSSGLMGAKYIEIEPGGSEDYIQAGGEFSYTQDAMVVEELVDRIIGIGKANRKNSAKNCAANKNNLKENVNE